MGNLEVQKVQCAGPKLLYTFGCAIAVGEGDARALNTLFSANDSVVLSSEDGQYGVATGFVDDVQPQSISVLVGDTIRIQPRGKPMEINDVSTECGEQGEPLISPQIKAIKWRIDHHELPVGLAKCKRNLLRLFVGEEITPFQSVNHSGMAVVPPADGTCRRGHTRLRELVVELLPPKFSRHGASEDTDSISQQLNSRLNQDQGEAVRKVLSARDYALMLGMPGTGKTTTIVFIIRKLIAEGKSVLLSSYTNSAVDNVLLKLKSVGIDFLRLGRLESVDEQLHEHVPKPENFTSVASIRNFMEGFNVVGATCLGASDPLLSKQIFDYCIVDEASQVTLPVCLGPLYHARTFVLVGDHYQLPPLVRNAEAKDKGMGVSLFHRLSEAHPGAVVHLQSQYRMNDDIMHLSNTLIYNHRLRCGSTAVANRSLNVPVQGLAALSKVLGVSDPSSSWLLQLMDPNRRVVFLDTDALPATESSGPGGIINSVEASLVSKIIHAYVTAHVDPSSFGVISPYRAQLKELSSKLGALATRVDVMTVDKYQGRDKDCIVLSLVRSNSARRIGKLLRDWQRANVAFTRARSKLIVIGSMKTVGSRPPLADFITLVCEMGWVLQLPQGSVTSYEGLLELARGL